MSSWFAFHKTRWGVLLSLVMLIAICAQAQWSSNPSMNTPVCTAAGNQLLVNMVNTIVSDGSGGAILAWWDGRDSSIFVQRLSPKGIKLWNPDGVRLDNSKSDQNSVRIVSDGYGGAIVLWTSGGLVVCRRIDGIGLSPWPGNRGYSAVLVSEYQTGLVADGVGGAFILYPRPITGNLVSPVVTRVGADGYDDWTTPMLSIGSLSPDNGASWGLASDGTGGVLATWVDYRAGNADIYAQRVSNGGATLWAVNGVPVCTDPVEQSNPSLVADGMGGTIVTWYDRRGFNPWAIYAQRINAAGSPQWAVNGVRVCTTNSDQRFFVVLPDGANGEYIAWRDDRAFSWDIYGQRLSPSGTLLWPSSGVPICTATNDQWHAAITGDGAGGAIIAWDDLRSGTYDIYAQRINAAGAALWSSNGIVVSGPAGNQDRPIILGLQGGAIVGWQDGRSLSSLDIYAQFINDDGRLGYPNLVVNGGFEPNGAPWWFWDNTPGIGAVRPPIVPWRGEATVARIAPHAFGSNIQFWQDGICLDPNTQYRLSFDCEVVGNPSGNAGVAISLHGIGVNYGLDQWKPPVNNSWQRYTVEFTTRNFTSRLCNARLQLQMGSVAGFNAVYSTYYFDNVVLTMSPAQQYRSISGWIFCGDPHLYSPRATMSGLVDNPQSGMNGYYAGVVPLGWSGTVTPIYDGCRFLPPSRTYGNVQSDLSNENYRVDSIRISGNIHANDGTLIPDAQVVGGTLIYALSDAQGNYTFWYPACTSMPIRVQKAGYLFGNETIFPPLWSPQVFNFVGTPIQVPNAVVNGDFTNNTDGWQFWNNHVRQTMYRTNWCANAPGLLLTMNQVGGSIKLFQENFPLMANWRYRLRFLGRSSHNHAVGVLIHRMPYAPVGFPWWQVNLTNSCQYYQQEFTTNGFTGTLTSDWLQFEFGPYTSVVGEQYYFDDIELTPLGPAKESAEEVAAVPTECKLEQNYPNPFNPTTTINYQLPIANRVSLKVYDLLGREVATLVDGEESEGYKSVQFDASKLASGVYLYSLQAGGFKSVKKLAVLK